ncbi:MAG: glutamate--tRNA ligase [Candidatus Micrarchaeia archaeon]
MDSNINDLKDKIKKYAIKNAIDYGKANANSVFGKIVKDYKNMPLKELSTIVNEVVAEVNALSKDDLNKEYKKYEKEFEVYEMKKAEESKPKLFIEGAEKGKVITRFPPEPGGFIHIGNAKQGILSDEIAKMYDGKIYLYFDDTNPEKCKQEFVDAIKRDTSWLGIKFSKEYYASDFIERIYEYGKKLIESGNAYACLCSKEEIKENRFNKTECKHRNQSVEENLGLFNDMLAGKYDEGQIIIRLKVDMKADNATMRDPTIFRIKKIPHYRQGTKYIVWPTYHINTLIVDALNGVTDVIKSKEYEIWDQLHKKLLKLMNLPIPRIHYEARLRIKGTTTAKRDMRKFLSEGLIKSWDDPRLVTIIALRRRGIQPAAIRAFVLRAGFSLTDSISDMAALLAENKKIIDPIAKHLFFVSKPIEINTNYEGDAHIKLYPKSDVEFRNYRIKKSILVSREDLEGLDEGNAIRLKDLIDIKINKIDNVNEKIEAERIDDAKGSKIIQWVPADNCIKCRILIPKELIDDKGNFNKDSLETIEGFVEGYATNLKVHDIVQFERFGYCILDDKENMQFIFISK